MFLKERINHQIALRISYQDFLIMRPFDRDGVGDALGETQFLDRAEVGDERLAQAGPGNEVDAYRVRTRSL